MSQQDVMMAGMMGGMYGPNQYSRFPRGIALSDIGYRGTPTDAYGNPIQPQAPPPGTTLNSPPSAQAPAAPAGPAWSVLGQSGSTGDPGLDAMMAQRAAPLGSPMMGITGGGPGSNTGITGWGMTPFRQQQGQQAQQQASQGPSPSGSYQNALDLLSNPGHVTTPGATVPQSQIGGQPSVLQQFLANQRGGTGAGNYSNTGFFDTLNALGGR